MRLIFLAFVFSTIATLLIIRLSPLLTSRAEDHDLSGPQKFHARPVPRIGGLAIILSVAMTLLIVPRIFNTTFNIISSQQVAMVMLSAVPAFGAGLIEDLTKTQTPRRRLFYAAVSALMGIQLIDAVIQKTDLPFVDFIVATEVGAIVLTVFVVAGVINAVNIIDGFNGLASLCTVMMLGAIAIISYEVGDALITAIAFAAIGAVLGFFVWNFPAGLIFLGDGGAYFLGFIVAELGILLIHRNSNVSPLFPLMVCIYPVFEVLFSMYRRAVVKGESMGTPDGVHLHSLIFRRLVRWGTGNKAITMRNRRNSMTAPYLWILCFSTLVPAVLWWDSTPILGFYIVAFAIVYIGLYWRIVRFQVPPWLVIRRRR